MGVSGLLMDDLMMGGEYSSDEHSSGEYSPPQFVEEPNVGCSTGVASA